MTWSPNVAVSNAFNPSEGYPNQNKIGDYITIVSDETGGNVAVLRYVQLQPEQRPARRRRLLRSGIPWWTGAHTDTNANSVTELLHQQAHLQLLLRQRQRLQRRHSNSNSNNYSTAYTYSKDCPYAEGATDSATETVEPM